MNRRRVKYFLAAIPAFYLPACYIVMVCWGLHAVLTGQDITPQNGSALKWFGEIWLYGTLLQLPVYILWVLFSSELTFRLKIAWFVLLFFGNMFAIPYLLVFKYRKKAREGMLNLIGKQSVKQWMVKN